MDARTQAERELLRRLGDGRFHSGEELGAALGCSRAYLWKLMRGLRDDGVWIDSIAGRGYRLAAPVELLDAAAIRAAMPAAEPGLDLQVVDRIDSTNRALMTAAASLSGPTLLLAERQTAGRGRWGREWRAPFGGALAMSLLWPFSGSALGGLSLAAGVALAEGLRELGLSEVGVKWPNDLLLQGRKLGGILVELSGEIGGPVKAVIGVGLNVALQPEVRQAIGQPVADLAGALGPEAYRRNRLAGVLAHRLIMACRVFEQEGFAGFHRRWDACDALRGQSITLHLPTGAVEGIMRGVDEGGALVLEQADGRQTYFTGETQLKVRR